MKAHGSGKRITTLFILASLTCGLFTGCKKGDDMFPSIVPPTEQTGVSEETDVTEDDFAESDIRMLNVALPYSDLTVQCLVSMFYCKNNGLWDSSDSGINVDTDYLSSIATNYVISNIGCGSTGATLDMVRSWKNGDTMPDLFLAQDSNAVWEAGYAGDL
ncbi:MAG: hypothetical protein K6G81_02870, partial [Lachnospiraceae bacterium]|nr:hypothetical protein [Lachnospiraceae bacterium]